MTTTDLFARSRDDEMLALWNAGKHCEAIGLELGIPEMRVIHELNRVLNERAAQYERSLR